MDSAIALVRSPQSRFHAASCPTGRSFGPRSTAYPAGSADPSLHSRRIAPTLIHYGTILDISSDIGPWYPRWVPTMIEGVHPSRREPLTFATRPSSLSL